MERYFNFHNSDDTNSRKEAYKQGKQKVAAALKEVRSLMAIVNDYIKKNVSQANDPNPPTHSQTLLDALKATELRAQTRKIYAALSSYYTFNDAMWSNFKSLWKKLHRTQHCEIGKSKNKEEIVVRALIAATGSKDYSKVKKGIIPVLRLTISNGKELCGDILSQENKLETTLRRGGIKIKNENLPDGPILGAD